MFTRGKASRSLAGWLVTAAVVGVVAVLGALLVNGRRADAVTVPFTRLSMAGSTAGDCKALADVDLDGDLDAVVGGFTTLRWFRYDGAAGWAPFTVDSPGGEFTTDCQAADMDGDGDADIVAPNNAGSGALSVYRNPRNPNGDPTVTAAWTRTTINASAGYIHDVEVADMAGDSRLDVVTRRQGNLSLWVQNADGTWAAPQTLNAPSGEGLALGDLDADTDVDVVAGGAWLVNPRVGGGGWTAGPAIVPDQAWGSAAVADMNADGVNDVVLGPLEDRGSPDLAWYSRSGGGWVKTLIKTVGVTAGQNRVHTLKVAKIDAGDSLDVVTGVMRHSNASSGGSLSVFTNDNGSWSEQVVSSTDGVHNVRVGDVERDGDIDILAVNYAGNATPALLWRNDRLAPPDTTPPGTPGAPSAVGAPGSTSLSITWTASTDNTDGSGLKNYDVVRVNAPGGAATLATVTTNTATLTGLSPNTAYQLAVRARDNANNTSPLGPSATITTAAQQSGDTLAYSSSPNRSTPTPLEGQTLPASGNVYIFLQTPTTYTQVRFYLDVPTTSAATQTEGAAPYDLRGGSVTTANAQNLANLSAGPHTLTAVAQLANGTTITTTARFTRG